MGGLKKKMGGKEEYKRDASQNQQQNKWNWRMKCWYMPLLPWPPEFFAQVPSRQTPQIQSLATFRQLPLCWSAALPHFHKLQQGKGKDGSKHANGIWPCETGTQRRRNVLLKNSLSSFSSMSWGRLPTKSWWLSGYRTIRRLSMSPESDSPLPPAEKQSHSCSAVQLQQLSISLKSEDVT